MHFRNCIVKVLCHLEGITCSAVTRHNANDVCDECEAQVCKECLHPMRRHKHEMLADSTHDMSFVHGPEELCT